MYLNKKKNRVQKIDFKQNLKSLLKSDYVPVLWRRFINFNIEFLVLSDI